MVDFFFSIYIPVAILVFVFARVFSDEPDVIGDIILALAWPAVIFVIILAFLVQLAFGDE